MWQFKNPRSRTEFPKIGSFLHSAQKRVKALVKSSLHFILKLGFALDQSALQFSQTCHAMSVRPYRLQCTKGRIDSCTCQLLNLRQAALPEFAHGGTYTRKVYSFSCPKFATLSTGSKLYLVAPNSSHLDMASEVSTMHEAKILK